MYNRQDKSDKAITERRVTKLIRKVQGTQGTIEYQLTRKQVKNINLMVKADGRVYVSANQRVPIGYIDEFVVSKEALIQKALRKLAQLEQSAPPDMQYMSQEQLAEVLQMLCKEAYTKLAPYHIPAPTIKIRKMKSRWGSCIPQKASITFSTHLAAVPLSCVEYVVYHEFAHLVHPNHSKQFYDFLGQLMPDYKERKNKLKEYNYVTERGS